MIDIKRVHQLIILLFITTVCWSNENLKDSLSLFEKKISGNYYPHWKMSEGLINKLPIKMKMHVAITDLHSIGLDGKNTFLVSMINEVSTNRDINNLSSDDSLDLVITDFINIIGDGIDLNWSNWDTEEMDSVEAQYDEAFSYKESHSFSGIVPFKWNLRDYPFDVQKLVIKYQTQVDTSFAQLEFHEDYAHVNELNLLADGYSVTSEDVEEEIILFEKLDLQHYADSTRSTMIQTHKITINLNRNGSFLYFKLFFGSILAFIISLLAFFIPIQEFEARMTLCIGSVFGAIGNKYFVESSMPEVQVLTKADIINNIMILLVIINIFIIVAQSSKKLNLGILEKSRNAMVFLVILFLISNLIVVYI